MMRFLILSFFISSCSLHTTSTGGNRSYVYNPQNSYALDELSLLAPDLIKVTRRDPRRGKLKDLFSSNMPPVKKIGIIVFESKIQPTLSGLAGKDKIYLSESGKQLLTENFLSIWEESFRTLASQSLYVPISKILQSTALHQYGFLEDDYVKTPRRVLDSSDIFFLEKGKKTTMATTLNPRGMRDLSLLLVPASELMGGAKWSEHQKHFVNDVAKELNLDAALVVMSEFSWTAAHTDKRSGESVPEEMLLELNATVVVPLSRYHERLEQLKIKDRPRLTLSLGHYQAKIKAPVVLSLPDEEKTFDNIQKNLLGPGIKVYKDLSQMMILQIMKDLEPPR